MGADEPAPSVCVRPLLQGARSIREINISACHAGSEQFPDDLPQAWPLRLEDGHSTGQGAPNLNWNPVAHDITRRAAEKLDGDPRGYYFDIFNRPTTAHFIGGCAIGDSPATGVVDPYQRLYGYSGLHIIDGSTITANLGVNPALTITAMSERAVALWPNEGESDPRPPLGSAYQQISPVRPRNPIVPESAPAALRLSPI